MFVHAVWNCHFDTGGSSEEWRNGVGRRSPCWNHYQSGIRSSLWSAGSAVNCLSLTPNAHPQLQSSNPIPITTAPITKTVRNVIIATGIFEFQLIYFRWVRYKSLDSTTVFGRGVFFESVFVQSQSISEKSGSEENEALGQIKSSKQLILILERRQLIGHFLFRLSQ